MKTRPALVPGALVKLHKRYFHKDNRIFIVLGIDYHRSGQEDGRDRVKLYDFDSNKIVACVRKKLWFTGKVVEFRSLKECQLRSEPIKAQKLIENRDFNTFFALGFNVKYPELLPK